MNIGYVVNEPIPYVHGGSTHIYEVAHGLQQRGHKVVVIAPLMPGQKKLENLYGLTIIRRKADYGFIPFDISVMGNSIKEHGFYFRPIKIFEYMAMALPVVTVDISPLNEIIRNGCEGLLVKPDNLAALESKITKLLDNDLLAKKLGENARSRVVANYSWEAHVIELEKVLNNAVFSYKPAFYETKDLSVNKLA